MNGPLLVGLTGSIGMGKTETTRMFARLGIPTYDADAAVHRLYEPGGAAVDAIAKEFPGTVYEGRVDRAALTKALAADATGFKRLEAIVHPLVAREQLKFLEDNAGADMVVLDIPLLFETGGHARMDAVVVVSAPRHVQRMRVLAREGMTEEKLDHILSRQMDNEEKRAKAHFVIETDKGLDHAFGQVKRAVDELRAKRLKHSDA
ncbi:MAG TPA: dephospho-CoA kinase [Rhizomicrobium sp.]|jgi:dephospho-CoA kinase|nr:dephospho-CoA kinase [Rhizomicrobium sp.]